MCMERSLTQDSLDRALRTLVMAGRCATDILGKFIFYLHEG